MSREEVIGDCRLIMGDCRELIGSVGKVDCVITDPPYELDIAQGNKGCFEKSYKKLTGDALQAIAASFSEAECLSEWSTTGAQTIFCFCSNKQVARLMLGFEALGFLVTLLAWHKFNSVPFSHGTWRQDAEWLIHAKRPGAPLNGDSEAKRKIKAHPLCTECPEHPTTKPLTLIRDYVEIGSNSGDSILDPFMGSGTTGVACVQTGRRFIGIEKEEKYFNIAVKRIDRAVQLAKCNLFRDEPAQQPKQQAFELD